MAIFLSTGLFIFKIRRRCAKAILPTLLTHPQPSSEPKMYFVLFSETGLADKMTACARTSRSPTK